ncbi:hypothetical protein U1Q18_017629 [Sarracenia purpurea var. burkii]
MFYAGSSDGTLLMWNTVDSGLSDGTLLVHPAYAWIDPLLEDSSVMKEHYPTAGIDAHAQRSQSYVDVEKLDNEFVLTSAEYFLSLANINWTFTSTYTQFRILFGNASFANMEMSGCCVICFVNTVCFPHNPVQASFEVWCLEFSGFAVGWFF